MIIDVTLYDQDSDCTRTRFAIDGVFSGFGMEDEARAVKVRGETRIPNGKYPLKLRHSPKFSSSYYRDDVGNLMLASKRTTPDLIAKYHTQHELIWITGVPGFEYVLIHWGNTDDNTDGCYLVGTGIGNINGQKAITRSRDKYVQIYPKIWRAINSSEGVMIIFNR